MAQDLHWQAFNFDSGRLRWPEDIVNTMTSGYTKMTSSECIDVANITEPRTKKSKMSSEKEIENLRDGSHTNSVTCFYWRVWTRQIFFFWTVRMVVAIYFVTHCMQACTCDWQQSCEDVCPLASKWRARRNVVRLRASKSASFYLQHLPCIFTTKVFSTLRPTNVRRSGSW